MHDGNTARALIKFGYEEDPRVKSAMEWMVENSTKLGGWCLLWKREKSGFVGTHERVCRVPQTKVDEGNAHGCREAAEFYLEREANTVRGSTTNRGIASIIQSITTTIFSLVSNS